MRASPSQRFSPSAVLNHRRRDRAAGAPSESRSPSVSWRDALNMPLSPSLSLSAVLRMPEHEIDNISSASKSIAASGATSDLPTPPSSTVSALTDQTLARPIRAQFDLDHESSATVTKEGSGGVVEESKYSPMNVVRISTTRSIDLPDEKYSLSSRRELRQRISKSPTVATPHRFSSLIPDKFQVRIPVDASVASSEATAIGADSIEDALGVDSSRVKARTSLVISSLVVLIIFAVLGFYIYDLYVQSVNDGNWWRFALLAAAPLWMSFLIFPLSYSLRGLVMILGPVRNLIMNTQYYSAVPPELKAESIKEHLPSITIQIPVYCESLDNVLRPTLKSLKKAAKKYAELGGSVRLFVNDDGLQVLKDDLEIENRIAFYSSHNIPFVARPAENRRGCFKKASNMNYCMNISNKVSEILAANPKVHPEEALEFLWKSMGEEFIGGGDVTLGDFILLVDADTRVPETCLVDAISEFLQEKKLGFTQHRTQALRISKDSWEEFIANFTEDIYDVGIAMATASGDICPLLGHNCIIRKKALQEASTVAVGEENAEYPKFGSFRYYWSEKHVSEDFDLAIRLQMLGYHGRYVTYTGDEFLEGVSLTYADEISRIKKYAYGACEIVFNKIYDWPRKGLFSPIIWNLVVSTRAPWHSKLSLIGYLANFFALSCLFLLMWTSFILWALFPYMRNNVSRPLDVMLTSAIVFTGIGLLSAILIRYRVLKNPVTSSSKHSSEMSLCAHVIRELKLVVPLALFWNSVSWHLFIVMLSHFFGIPIHWSATKKEISESDKYDREHTSSCVAILRTLANFWSMYVAMSVQLAGYILAVVFLGFELNATSAVPILMVLGGHMLAPLLLNPLVSRCLF